ncbi:MAG: helix-turn-helix domain-containing protein [Thermomonas sp.]|uniref:helix-turn-helix domain-containing protein n=1 Tax=Thermomonas sp. TaxID=1971895 RepID=UPI002612AE6B|nr:helix-turn-helix domain-containing protein [Thermomonas sp.]MCC7097860.1 helix-turn-helix domain-containing protein [Thermomonas sp.]
MCRQLTEAERYILSRHKRGGPSFRAIAHALGRILGTISRELKRNATLAVAKGRAFHVPSKAQEHTYGRRNHSRRVKHHGPEVYAHIEGRLTELQWSPEQIANELPIQLGVSLNPMTICRHVRQNQWAGSSLFKQLRQGGKRRRKRSYGVENRGNPGGKPMIDSCPAEVEGWHRQTLSGHHGMSTVLKRPARICYGRRQNTGWPESNDRSAK